MGDEFKAVDGDNAVPQFITLNDRSVWIQRSALSGLVHLNGTQRHIFRGPVEAAEYPQGKSCGLIRLHDGLLQISTSPSSLLIAKHAFNGTLLSTTSAPLPKTGSVRQPCASFRVGEQLAVVATDLFAVDLMTGGILWRSPIPALGDVADVEAFGSSWIASGQFAGRARLIRIQAGGAITILSPPHDEQAESSKAKDVVLGPDGIIVSAIVSRWGNGRIIEAPILSRYSADVELTLDPQPVERLIARRGAIIGSVLSADLAEHYFAWTDWNAGANTMVVEKRNSQTGAVLWSQRVALGPEHLGQRPLWAAPTLVLSASRLFISSYAWKDDFEDAYATSVLSLDTSTGAFVGRREWGASPAAIGGAWVRSISVDRFDRPYLLLNSGASTDVLLALSSDLQSTRWEATTDAGAGVTVVGEVVMTSGSDVRALELDTGQQRWSVAILASPVLSILSLPNDRIALVTIRTSGPRTSGVAVLDRLTGSLIWATELSALGPETAIERAMVYGDDAGIFVGGFRTALPLLTGPEAPFVARLDAATGQLSWLYSPAFGNGRTRVISMIPGADGEIWARTSQTEYVAGLGFSLWQSNRGELLRLRGADGSVVGRQVLTTATAPLAAPSSTSSAFLARNQSTWWLQDLVRPSLQSRKTQLRALPAPQFRLSQISAAIAPTAVSVNQNGEFSVAVTLSNAAASPFSGTLSLAFPPWIGLRQPEPPTVVTLAAGEQRELNYQLFVHGPLDFCDPNAISEGNFSATLIPDIRETLASPALPQASVNIRGRSDQLFSSSLEPISPNECNL